MSYCSLTSPPHPPTPHLGCMSICLCSYLGMFKLMLIPELVREGHSSHSTTEWNGAVWKMIQPKKIRGKELSACDLHQAARALQSSCTDINHRSAAINILLITIGLTDLYLVPLTVICMACNVKSSDWGDATCVTEMFPGIWLYALMQILGKWVKYPVTSFSLFADFKVSIRLQMTRKVNVN